MKNTFLDQRTAKAIDTQVAKVLRGLGNPQPPLDLNSVRSLLKLDLQYYSSKNDNAVREFVSRVKVAGKLLIEKPTRILDLIIKFDLKALYVPDRNRILLDSSQPKLKWRWFEGHEIIHSVIPHHSPLMHGDDLYTLSPDCHAQLENEANYGAGRLLFLQSQLEHFVRSTPPSFRIVKEASKHFHNTMTSSLWRVVETLDIPAVGIVSQHPKYTDATFDPSNPCRYFIRSRKFLDEFSNVSEQDAFRVVQAACTYKQGGPIAGGEVVLTNDRGEKHVFLLEAFYNRYEALSLAIHSKARAVATAVPSSIIQ